MIRGHIRHPPLFNTILSQNNPIIREINVMFNSACPASIMGLHLAHRWGLETTREEEGHHRIGGRIRYIDATTEI